MEVQAKFNATIDALETARGFLDLLQECEECDAAAMVRPARALVATAVGNLGELKDDTAVLGRGRFRPLGEVTAELVARINHDR